jgi:hypothetical protein
MEPTKTKMHDPEMLAELRRLDLDTTVTTAEIRGEARLVEEALPQPRPRDRPAAAKREESNTAIAARGL